MKSHWFSPRVYLNILLHRWGPYNFVFLHPIKALFYKDTCCPLGGLDPVSSPFMCGFLGGGLGSGKENRLLKCRTEQLSFMQGLRLLPLLFSHPPPSGHGGPRGVCLAADLPPACEMLAVTPRDPPPPSRELLFKNRLVKNPAPKTHPSWGHF